MNVLVLGASGFIGSHVTEELSRAGVEVFAGDLRPSQWETGVPATLVDVRRPRAVADAIERAGAVVVVNLAGILGTAETFERTTAVYETNVLGAINVLEACASSGARYVGIETGTPWLNPYAASKRAASDIAHSFGAWRDVEVTIVRLFNAFGPRQHGIEPVRKIVPQFIRSAFLGQPLPIFGDGEQIIDMVHVDTCASAIVQAALRDQAAGQTIPIGTGIATTVREVASAICTLTGADLASQDLGDRLGEGVEHPVADTRLMSDLLGVPPDQDPLSRLGSVVDWYRANPGILKLA